MKITHTTLDKRTGKTLRWTPRRTDTGQVIVATRTPVAGRHKEDRHLYMTDHDAAAGLSRDEFCIWMVSNEPGRPPSLFVGRKVRIEP